jgi:hypothetical protein
VARIQGFVVRICLLFLRGGGVVVVHFVWFVWVGFGRFDGGIRGQEESLDCIALRSRDSFFVYIECHYFPLPNGIIAYAFSFFNMHFSLAIHSIL